MITRRNGFPDTYMGYPQDQWIGRGGKASWLPQQGPPQRELHTGGAMTWAPAQPNLMMDPSDPSTWQRPYVFTT
jgi:hypothetical protein